MCLILFAYRVHPVFNLIVAANRDEFYQRPTSPTHYWEESPQILAGRDLEKMGTWMGITKTGRFAALTNYRDPSEQTEGKRSRGELVAEALKFTGNAKEYMDNLTNNKNQYPGYNILVGDGNDLYYYSNRGQEPKRLEPGIYGVSNHLLNTEWPKVKLGKAGLTKIIKDNHEDFVENLLILLQNADQVPDDMLPNTGVSLEWERMLSSMFIDSENYGTRSSTILLMSEKQIQYVERVFSKGNVHNQQFIIDL